jgi:hypothetical protein
LIWRLLHRAHGIVTAKRFLVQAPAYPKG